MTPLVTCDSEVFRFPKVGHTFASSDAAQATFTRYTRQLGHSLRHSVGIDGNFRSFHCENSSSPFVALNRHSTCPYVLVIARLENAQVWLLLISCRRGSELKSDIFFRILKQAVTTHCLACQEKTLQEGLAESGNATTKVVELVVDAVVGTDEEHLRRWRHRQGLYQDVLFLSALLLVRAAFLPHLCHLMKMRENAYLISVEEAFPAMSSGCADRLVLVMTVPKS